MKGQMNAMAPKIGAWARGRGSDGVAPKVQPRVQNPTQGGLFDRIRAASSQQTQPNNRAGLLAQALMQRRQG